MATLTLYLNLASSIITLIRAGQNIYQHGSTIMSGMRTKEDLIEPAVMQALKEKHDEGVEVTINGQPFSTFV